MAIIATAHYSLVTIVCFATIYCTKAIMHMNNNNLLSFSQKLQPQLGLRECCVAYPADSEAS